MRTRWAAPALLLLLAGCGSSEGDLPQAETPESTLAASTVPASSAPASAVPASDVPASDVPSSAVASPAAESTGPPPTTGPVHHVGDRVRLTTGSVMTVFTWHRAAQRPGPAAAGAWWAADIEFCLTRVFGSDFREPIGNIRSQLRVEVADGSVLAAEDDARTPDEVYAQDIPVIAGRCRRGELVFDVPTGQEATFLAATVSSFGWVRWQLS
jgi:hypothetical protein